MAKHTKKKRQRRLSGKNPFPHLPLEVTNEVLILLDELTLVQLSHTCSFFAKICKDDFYWKPRVHEFLSQDVKLNNNETYYLFFLRNRKFIIKFNSLKKSNLNKKEIFFYLCDLVKNGLDKTFVNTLNLYPRFNINAYSDDGTTLVHYAVSINNTIILNTLIKKNAHLIGRAKFYNMSEIYDEGKFDFGLTPLQLAAQNGAYECMKILLMHNKVKATIDFQNLAWQKTALHYAAEGGHVACTELLIKTGASLRLRDNDNKSAYELAAMNGNTACMKIIATAMEEKNIPFKLKLENSI